MKKIFTVLVASIFCVFAYGSFTSLAYAECKPSLAYYSSPTDTSSTNTIFFFVARLQPDCGTEGYKIGGAGPNGGVTVSSGAFFPNYANGDYLQDVQLTFPDLGTWKVAVRKANQPFAIGEVKEITITAEDNSQIKLKCGDYTPATLFSCSKGYPGQCCPDECSSTAAPEGPAGSKWRCGANDLSPGKGCNPNYQDNPEFRCPNGYSCRETTPGSKSWVCGGQLPIDVESRCNLQKDILQHLPYCRGPNAGMDVGKKYKLDNYNRCGGEGKPGYVCDSAAGRLCLLCTDNNCYREEDNGAAQVFTGQVKCEVLPVASPCENGKCETGLGFSFSVDDPQKFISDLFRFALMIAGVAGLLILIYSGYIYMTSAGDKTKVQAAREAITSVIAGLLFLIFSITILEIIGVDILTIPGFTR